MTSVSIVTYNHPFPQIRRLVMILLESVYVSKVYIIDNSPGTELESHFKYEPATVFPEDQKERLEYIHTGDNRGYGGGHNIAMKKAIEAKIPYHLVINPDVVLNQDVIGSLYLFMEKNLSAGNVMPEVRYPDGNLQYLCKLLPTPYDWIGRRFNPFRRMVEQRNKLFELRFTGYRGIMDVPYLSGCFMFLRTETLKKTGLFDERIFMYGEETDLCRRIIHSGYRVVYYPEIHVYHEFQKGSHNSLKLTYVGIKSAVYYFNKWGWFFDRERKNINARTLKELGYKRG